ncbi:hypothetical protein ATANTOWER_001820 [Ataeniobius toweri]|uniref:Uncharacterized protein n=1 Tax=Ataeniobius toweri TaxID=208326 RepID=A0ABU7B6R8_9TELE|nr:hypothetical protein [Ataeniobius toweri]
MMDAASSLQIVVNTPNVLVEADCGNSVDLPGDDHLMTLKALTEKLRLETRRPSYLEWKARLEAESFKESQIGKFQLQEERDGEPVTNKEAVASSDKNQRKQPLGVLNGFENVDEALSWLRRELVRPRFNLSDHFHFTHICFSSTFFKKYCSTFEIQTQTFFATLPIRV